MSSKGQQKAMVPDWEEAADPEDRRPLFWLADVCAWTGYARNTIGAILGPVATQPGSHAPSYCWAQILYLVKRQLALRPVRTADDLTFARKLMSRPRRRSQVRCPYCGDPISLRTNGVERLVMYDANGDAHSDYCLGSDDLASEA